MLRIDTCKARTHCTAVVWWDGGMETSAVAQGVEQVRARITTARGAEQGVEYLWRDGRHKNVGHMQNKDTDG